MVDSMWDKVQANATWSWLYLIYHLPLHSLSILLNSVKGGKGAAQPALHVLSLSLQHRHIVLQSSVAGCCDVPDL